MKYSFIIPFRNRQQHLDILLSALKRHISDNSLNAEILVAVQADNFGFRRGALFDEAFKNATGDIIVCHDVDHIPTDGVKYWDEKSDVFLPIGKMEFVDNELNPSKIKDGYQGYDNLVPDNHYGGVITLTRTAFDQIKGFNPLYCGWGCEDEDLRERIRTSDLSVSRNHDGKFLVLSHEDTNPEMAPSDSPPWVQEQYLANRKILMQFDKFKSIGYRHQQWTLPLCALSTEDSTSARLYSAQEDGVLYYYYRDCMPNITKENSNTLKIGRLATLYYEDTEECHAEIWKGMASNVNNNPTLKSHRDWVEANNWGYGNRPLIWMWNILVRDLMPMNFKFLEIGVFKGQIISLISLLSKMYDMNGSIIGITPLSADGDHYNKHPDIDYENAIQTIYATFGLDASDLTLIKGFSTDENIYRITKNEFPEINMLYIDGCHDYEAVKSDLEKYCPLVTIDGIVVVDDASTDLNIPKGLIEQDWKGLEDVTRATKEYFDDSPDFELLFAVGHNKIYMKRK